MPNALIYSADFDGHRQVYVFVYASILEELGYNIYVAGNTKLSYFNSFYIDKLKNSFQVKIIDTSKFVCGGIRITPEEFLALQDECRADVTILTEADLHISLLVSQRFNRKSRFRGKLIGLFLRPFYYYKQNSILDELRYLKHLPKEWKHDDRLFHEVLLKRFSLLDFALCIDENFVAHHDNLHWLPDVFQQYADSIIKDEKTEQRDWIERLQAFTEKNFGKFIFLYFGTAQFRRGYDILLKMAVDWGGCFIHCGMNSRDVKYEYNVEELRTLLLKSGSLFETNQYLEDPVSIEFFFKSATHIVLPYRNFYGSSGVMLQALSLGIPVLSSENGIMGYRINKYNLGVAYDEKRKNSLYTQFDYFRTLNPKQFENRISDYMRCQTPLQLQKVLVNSISGVKEFVQIP